MNKILAFMGAVFLLIIMVAVSVTSGWFNTWFGNKVKYVDRKIDDVTNYEKRKTVEDTCRSMIASYEADKLTWDQYKDSDSAEKRGWAEQAKMRANRTSSTYNNYILENSYVWKDNIPNDIRKELEYLK